MNKGTSIQYQLSNVEMFNFVYGTWDDFMKVLDSGKEAVKEMMFNKWSELKEELVARDDLEIWDKDKVVTKEDFDIFLHKSNKGINVFYIVFPETKAPAASICIAIAMTYKMPRYFTMEYSDLISDYIDMYGEEKVIEMFGREVYETKKNNPDYVLGEFVLTKEGRKHKNLGQIPDKTIANFAKLVEEVIDKEVLDKKDESMQGKIKEILSLSKEEGIEKYKNFLADLYKTPVLWTVLHRDYCNISYACGRPNVVDDQNSEKRVIRLFTEYKFAVDFCVKNPDYSYNGVPLVAMLSKEQADYSGLFSIAVHMGVTHICLDDCSIAQCLNFSLDDFVSINNIDVAVSYLASEESQVDNKIQVNNEWIDLFSYNMVNRFINPLVADYFSAEQAKVRSYLENRAPFVYVLFMGYWINCLINDPEWCEKNKDDLVEAQKAYTYIKGLIVKRLNDCKLGDKAMLVVMGQENNLYDCGEETIGILANDIGYRRYMQSIAKRIDDDINCFDIQPGRLKEVVTSIEKSGAKFIRFILPYNDKVSVVIPIEEVFGYFVPDEEIGW